MKKLILLLLFIPLVSFGQTKQGIELCLEYQKVVSGFTSEKEANKALDKILNVIGASKNFTLIPCDNINNALAITFKGERFILFDGEFMRKITQLTNNWANLFILAHEVGHHINGHTRDFLLAPVLDDHSLADRRKEELEADEFASFIVSKLGASYAQIEETIDLIASNESDQYSTHPSYDKRIAAVKKGFDRSYSSSGTSKSNSSNRNKSSVVISNSNPSDLKPVFDRSRKYFRTRSYGLEEYYGSWVRESRYWLDDVGTRYNSTTKKFEVIDDPFKLEEYKETFAIKEVTATSKGKPLSPYGSKNLVLEIETDYYTYDYYKKPNGEKLYYYIKPNTSFSLILKGYEEMPKDIKWTYSEGANKKVYATFDYIIDRKFSGTFVCTFDGWYDYEGKQEMSSIDLNGWLSKYFQNQNYEFIERVKAGNKLYIRFGKLFYWRAANEDGSFDISSTSNEYNIPRYSYEFDLTGSSKAIRLID